MKGKEKVVDPLPDVLGVRPLRTLEHLKVALCSASGGPEICISAAVGTDDSRNRGASGPYIFNFPFIHHLNVLKLVIREILSIKSPHSPISNVLIPHKTNLPLMSLW